MRIFEDIFDDGFFNSFFKQPFRSRFLLPNTQEISLGEGIRNTALDVWEEQGKIKAKIDLPGIDKKDIDIKIHDNMIEIKAQKKFENKEDGKDFLRQERSFSGFYKLFSLPHKIDSEKVDAKYENGVLEITAPKSEKETKKIEVK